MHVQLRSPYYAHFTCKLDDKFRRPGYTVDLEMLDAAMHGLQTCAPAGEGAPPRHLGAAGDQPFRHFWAWLPGETSPLT